VLQHADEADDLELREEGDRVPDLRRRGARGNDRLRARDREADPVGVHHVANEAEHRDAAVLDLRVAQEAWAGQQEQRPVSALGITRAA